MLLHLLTPVKGRRFEKKYSAVNYKNLSFSFCLALEINALILAINSAWSVYLNYLQSSEGPFRYGDKGFSSRGGILDNLNVVRHSFERYYSSVDTLPLNPYTFSNNEKLSFYCTLMLTPAWPRRQQLNLQLIKHKRL